MFNAIFTQTLMDKRQTLIDVEIGKKRYINVSGRERQIELNGVVFKVERSNIIINTKTEKKLINSGTSLLLETYSTFYSELDKKKYEALSILFPDSIILTNNI